MGTNIIMVLTIMIYCVCYRSVRIIQTCFCHKAKHLSLVASRSQLLVSFEYNWYSASYIYDILLTFDDKVFAFVLLRGCERTNNLKQIA